MPTTAADGGQRLDVIGVDLQLADALRRCKESAAAQAALEQILARTDPKRPADAAAVAVANLGLVQVHRALGSHEQVQLYLRAAKGAVLRALIAMPGNRHLLGMLCLHELYDLDERRMIGDEDLVNACRTRAQTLLAELSIQFPHWRILDLLRWQLFARDIEILVTRDLPAMLDEHVDNVVDDLDACLAPDMGSRRIAEAAYAMITRIAAALPHGVDKHPELAAHLVHWRDQLRRTGGVPDPADLATRVDWECLAQLFERGAFELQDDTRPSRPSAALARAISSGLRDLGGKFISKNPEVALEHYEVAYEMMKGALAQDPSAINGRYFGYTASRRGITLMMLGRFEEAIGYLEEAVPPFLTEAGVRHPDRLHQFWIEYGPERRCERMLAAGASVPSAVLIRHARLLATAAKSLALDHRMPSLPRSQLQELYTRRCREFVVAAGGDAAAAGDDNRDIRQVLDIR